MNYKDDFQFPEAPLQVDGLGVFDPIYPSHAALKFRREQLDLTQQEAADRSGISLRQYQRFESGERSMQSASLRIGLSICHVLRLDPFRFVDLPDAE